MCGLWLIKPFESTIRALLCALNPIIVGFLLFERFTKRDAK